MATPNGSSRKKKKKKIEVFSILRFVQAFITFATEGEAGDVFTPVSLFVCLLLAKSKIFQVYWSVDFVILSVCLSSTGHTFLTDLHETSPHGKVCHKEEAYCF